MAFSNALVLLELTWYTLQREGYSSMRDKLPCSTRVRTASLSWRERWAIPSTVGYLCGGIPPQRCALQPWLGTLQHAQHILTLLATLCVNAGAQLAAVPYARAVPAGHSAAQLLLLGRGSLTADLWHLWNRRLRPLWRLTPTSRLA